MGTSNASGIAAPAYFQAIDTTAGKVKWSFATGARAYLLPVIAPNGLTVYFGSDDHNVYAVDAASGAKCRTRHAIPCVLLQR